MPKERSDAERRAFEYVGAYLFAFAKMEDELNSAIERLFDLSVAAASILSTLDLFKKLNVIQAVVLAEFSDPKGSEIGTEKNSAFKKLFAKLAKANDDRKIVAHAPFQPEGSAAVVFDKVTANGSLKRERVRWDYPSFDDKLDSLETTAAQLKEFVDGLTPYDAKLDFSDSRNSQYVALLF